MINKYVITEQVPYESEMTWTVFAPSFTEAEAWIKLDKKSYMGGELSISQTHLNIRGTKFIGVMKKSARRYFQ